jgi:uncharacterized protein (TIGR00661 family)
MSKFNINQPFKGKPLIKPRILLAPLDWGLGHATRCIPIIRQLISEGADVWLAGEKAQKDLLQQEFPELPFLPLDGYRIKYARSGIGLIFSLFRQTHKIFSAIKKENEWLKEKMVEYKFDAVISDNRYGLYHPDIPSIFITHQLTIKSPLGKWTEKILRKRNYRYINKFTECWVPDREEQENNLAGELSHPIDKPVIPVYYIGHLSRFKITDELVENTHLLIILSGPEPQRTILENKIIQEVAHYPSTATIVRGLPGADSIVPSTSMIKFYNHLPADELNKEIAKAAYVISRSGYSTVMDLVRLSKKGILIPTPGQTEQEYLADYLTKKQIAFCATQNEFSLESSLKNAKKFSYRLPESDSNKLLIQVISKTLSSLNRD